MNVGIVSPVSLERNSLKQLLINLGHEVFVIEASNGPVTTNTHDLDVLLVSDLVLLQVNKDNVSTRLQRDEKKQAVPAVVVIDQTAPNLEEIVNSIGADDFLIRPLNRFTLDARLRLVQNRLIKQKHDEALINKERLWLETIRKASELVTRAQKLENSFAAVAQHLQKIVPLDQFVISLDEESGVHYDVVKLESDSREPSHYTTELCQEKACSKRQTCGPGQKITCQYVKDENAQLSMGMNSCVCLGLYEGEHRLGALSLASHRHNAFDETQMPHLESLALQVAHTVANIQRYQQATGETRRLTTIIREVHHRIKNTLQGIIGLFSRYREDHPALAPMLNTAISQLYTVAEVHNLLSHHVQETVNWHALIQSICEVGNNLSHHQVEYTLTNSTAGLTVAASEAVPMALALNELIQNAISHGYPDGRTGTIRVTAVRASGEQGVCVTIANDGIAPTQDMDGKTKRRPGGGLDLVRSLLPPEARFRLDRQQDWTIAEAFYPADILIET